jgi:F0F1-type ATP synthase assembly protein I
MFGKPVNRRFLARLLALASVGVEMVVPAVIGLLIDRWLGSSPLGLIGGAVIGFVGALIHLIVLSQPRAEEEDPRGPKLS